MRVFPGIEKFAAAAGAELGRTDWLEIGQERIDRFAAAAGQPAAVVESIVRYVG